jgi:hypothetical protein
LYVEEEDCSCFSCAPGLLDSIYEEVDGIGGGAPRAASELVTWEQLVLVAEISEVFGNQGREKFAYGVKQADGAVRFGNFIAWLVWFAEDNRNGFEPALEVGLVFENSPEDKVKVVNEKVNTFNKNDVRNSIWAWSFVGFEGEGFSFDLRSGEGAGGVEGFRVGSVGGNVGRRRRRGKERAGERCAFSLVGGCKV